MRHFLNKYNLCFGFLCSSVSQYGSFYSVSKDTNLDVPVTILAASI